MDTSFDLINFLIEMLPYIASGAAVGVMIGLTGVGGGSVMTPILIGFGYNPAVAVGTDLLYATVTKAGGVYHHHKENNVEWRIVGAMALGSLPAAMITVLCLKLFFPDMSAYAHLLTTCLGAMLILTATVLLFKKCSSLKISVPWLDNLIHKHPLRWTFFLGIPLGAMVTLTSVGAGALGTALLLALYPALSGGRIVGTDLAHAVPLTFVAGIGHFFFLDTVDLKLLAGLLIGSIPATGLGTRLNKKVPSDLMITILSVFLMGIGIRYAFF